MSIFLKAIEDAKAKVHEASQQSLLVDWWKNRENRYERQGDFVVDKVREARVSNTLDKLNDQNKVMIDMMREMQQYLFASNNLIKRLQVLDQDESYKNGEDWARDLENFKAFSLRMSSLLNEYGKL